MANRAYLFSPEDEDYLLERGDEFYDSRWNIPLLWFLFFDEKSLTMLEVDKEDLDETIKEPIYETYLIEEKDTAIERFQSRIPVMKSLIDLSQIDLEEVIGNLNKWEGEQLVLDPGEYFMVFSDDEQEKAVEDFAVALKYLTNGEIDKYIKIFDGYAGSFDKIDKQNSQEIQNYLIGFTYW